MKLHNLTPAAGSVKKEKGSLDVVKDQVQVAQHPKDIKVQKPDQVSKVRGLLKEVRCLYRCVFQRGVSKISIRFHM
jgi:hypothetical protein